MSIGLRIVIGVLGVVFTCGHTAFGWSLLNSDVPNNHVLDAIPVTPSVMAGRILTHPIPVYPKEAKKKHISGVVVLHAFVGKDGKIEDLTVLSGPQELQASAVDAVKQWTYLPYEMNGAPVRVETDISVTYSMGREAARQRNGTMMTNGDEAVELSPDARELQKVKKVSPV